MKKLHHRILSAASDGSSALYRRWSHDQACWDACAEEADDDDEYGELCDCEPLPGVRSRIAQAARRLTAWAYVRWGPDTVFRRTTAWIQKLERHDTPLLSMIGRGREPTPPRMEWGWGSPKTTRHPEDD